MKRIMNIALTSVLAIALVIMASGVTFHHCSCSGKTTMLLGHLSELENTDVLPSTMQGCKPTSQKCMPQPKGCMTVSCISLSPTTTMSPVAFDFHVFQPLVAIINDWHIYQLTPQQVETTRSLLPTDIYSPPPRQYLHLLRVLTI